MGNIPFLLRPTAKDYLWGGSRLNDDFNLNISVSPFAEAWVCSTHHDGVSLCENREGLGERTSFRLDEVLKEHPEYIGTHPLQLTDGKIELPILIKLIDAKTDLSVQVHPDDEYALEHEHERGKTEMWYVLDAKRDSKLVYGFNQDVTPEMVKEGIEKGTIEELLNHVPIHKDDLFYIEAGTVHAIGAGTLVAEIQESSNITYRLYDYNRVDKNGKTRPLHIDKGLEVANIKSSLSPRQPMRVLKYKNGYASELLTRCKYFQVERLILNTEGRKMPSFKTESNSFHALVVVDGCGVIFGDDFMINFFKGDCVFVPANSIEMKLHGKAQILNVSC